MPPKNERNARLDNLRGFLIILVVTGHFISVQYNLTGVPFGRDEHPLPRFIFGLIYSFHMPALVFLSGYFSSLKRSSALTVGNLLALYVMGQCGFALLNVVVWRKIPLDGLLLINPSPGLWYLLSLFFWRLTIPVLQAIRRPLLLLVLLCAYGMLLGLLVEANWAFSVSRTITMLPFFAAGFWARRDGWRMMQKGLARIDLFFAFCTILPFPVLMYLGFKYGYGMFLLVTSFKDCLVPANVGLAFRAATYLCAFASIRWLYLLMPEFRSWLSYLGENTLPIYMGHLFVYTATPFCISVIFWQQNAIWLIPLFIVGNLLIFGRTNLTKALENASAKLAGYWFVPAAAETNQARK